MQKKTLYLVLTFIGAVVPMIAFVPWLVEHGLNPRLLLAELFANRISTFFALDLLMTAVVVVVFARAEGARGTHRWVILVVLCCVGVSAALPLLLFLREKEMLAGAAGPEGERAR